MKRCISLAMIPALLPILWFGVQHESYAADYDETLQGDLPHTGLLHTLPLDLGLNQVWGSVQVTALPDAPMWADHDSLAFSIAPDQQLVEISAQVWDLTGNMNWVRWHLFDTNTADASEVAPSLLTLQVLSPGSDQALGAWGPGLYQLRNVNMSWFGVPNNSAAMAGYRIDFVVRELTPAVPEPASWAMCVAGLGLLFAARRRRNRLA